MNTIPEACMAYTSVFQTLRLEMGIMLVAGVLIGFVAERWFRDRG